MAQSITIRSKHKIPTEHLKRKFVGAVMRGGVREITEPGSYRRAFNFAKKQCADRRVRSAGVMEVLGEKTYKMITIVK